MKSIRNPNPKATWKFTSAVTGVLAGSLLGLLVYGSSVDAAPVQSIHREYFNDSSLTNAVGARWVLQCNGGGNQQVWGRTTRNFVESTARCNGSTPPIEYCYVDGVPMPCPWPLSDLLK